MFWEAHIRGKRTFTYSDTGLMVLYLDAFLARVMGIAALHIRRTSVHINFELHFLKETIPR